VDLPTNFGNDTVDGDREGVPGREKLEGVSFDADLEGVSFDEDLERVERVPGLEEGDEDLVEHEEPGAEAGNAGRQSCSIILLHCCSAGFLAMILSIVAITR